MNILKIKNQKSGGTLALFEKDSYLSVSESVSEKAKLIRGDPPKIDFKKKGEPPKNEVIVIVIGIAVSKIGNYLYNYIHKIKNLKYP
jgi:hypothetical protein